MQKFSTNESLYSHTLASNKDRAQPVTC